jgi:hypothetical protein
MPRRSNKVKVSYGKASATPSSRAPKPVVVAMREPTPSTPMAQYIEDNKDSELTVQELIEQFQEYDCDHAAEFPVMTSAFKTVYLCESCRRLRKVEKDA